MGDFETTMELAAAATMAALDTETVVYTPRGGAARSIEAVITRGAPDPDIDVPVARVKVRNHATLGIDASAIDTGGDTLAWSPKRGGSNRTSRITDLLGADAGFVSVGVR